MIKTAIAVCIGALFATGALAQDINNPQTNATALTQGTLAAARLPSNAIWIGRQTFCASGCTSTGGTYTPTAGTNEINARCIGGGGGGAGAAATSATQDAIGIGGGAGGYTEGRFTSAFSGITVTIGAGGTAGTAGANPGGAGGSTTFGALMTASGGGAGQAGVAAVVGGVLSGSAGGAASGGDIQVPGQASQSAVYYSVSAVQTSGGGNSIWGAGGQTQATATTVTGSAGNGHGAGGGGGANAGNQASGAAGAAGSGGMCVVDEYR
jgi:hypothetical protein